MRTPVNAFPGETSARSRRLFAGFTLILLLVPLTSIAQSKDDFRSKNSDKWSKKGAWERFDGSKWKSAPNVPTNKDGVITIRSGHTIKVDKKYNVDQLIVENGATLKVDKRLTIVDGPGTDFVSLGAIEIKDKLRTIKTATASFGSTSVVDVKGGTLQFKQNSAATMLTGSVVNVQAGSDLFVSGSGTLTMNSGSVVNNFDRFRVNGTASLFTAGLIVNHSRLLVQQSGTATFLNNGVYEHALNAGALPSASRTTFSIGSTALFTGITTVLPTQMNNAFHHITWNSAGQTATLDLAGKPTAVSGDLSIASTGSGALSWVKGLNTSLNVGGNYAQTGGTFIYADGTGSGTMTVSGATNIAAGTTILSSGAGSPVMDLKSSLTITGGSLQTSGAGQGTVRFSGAAAQNVDASTGISGALDILVANTGGIRLVSPLVAPRNVTASSGQLNLNNQDLTVAGNLSVATSIASPSAVVFNGTGIQNLTYGPGLLTLPKLVVDNTGGALVTATDLTITTTASARNGTFDTNGKTVLFASGATLYAGGTVLGNVSFSRFYGLNADGWRMLATPIDGVAYSALNSIFHTQGGTWANLSGGTSNLQSLNFGIQNWNQITGADAPFSGGTGYIFYMFKDDRNGIPVLPATWSVTGTLRNVVPLTLSFNTTPSDSYNYVGNPTTSNLDWNAVVAASVNVGSSYATWDPALTPGGGMTGYKYYSSASGVGAAGRFVAPFTALMVQPLAAGAVLAFPTSEAANTQTASQFGKTHAISSHIGLEITNDYQAETETYIVFDGEAEDPGVLDDRFDVDRLQPLSPDYVTMWFMDDERKLAFDGRSNSTGLETFHLAVEASAEGLYTLRWPTLYEIPETWSLTLTDLGNGNVIDLRSETEYIFHVGADELATGKSDGLEISDRAARFTLVVRDPSRAPLEAESISLPSSPQLVQNFPNPFAGSTTIRVSVAETSPVTLENL